MSDLHLQLIRLGWFRYTPYMFIDGRQSKPRYRFGAPPLKAQGSANVPFVAADPDECKRIAETNIRRRLAAASYKR